MPIPLQPKPPPRRDPALDGLRGLAVGLVFLFHYGGGLRAHNPLVRALGYLTQAGWIGVEIFFALSGYLITGLLLDALGEPQRLRNFYARRAFRILPLYFVALIACGMAALVTGSNLAQLKPLLIYALFLQNVPWLLNAALHTPPPLPLHHLWSLAVEEQFYLIWPVLLLACRTPRQLLRMCLATFAFSCVFRAAIFGSNLWTDTTALRFAVVLPARAGALALGGAVAVYRRHAPTERLKRMGALFGFLGLAIFLASGLLTHTLLLGSRLSFLLGLPAVDLLSAAIIALSLSLPAVRRILGTRGFVFLGRISYGFYVLHILLEPFFDRIGRLVTHATTGFPYQTVRLFAAFPLTVLAAWLSFRLLEQPFLRLRR